MFKNRLSISAYNTSAGYLPFLGPKNSKFTIFNTIVDKNCSIGNDVRLNGGKHLADTNNELYTIKDGIIVVKKGVTIPNGFQV